MTSLAGALWTPRSLSLRAQAGHVTARRDQGVAAARRVEDLDPRVVESRVARVVTGVLVAPGAHPLGVHARRGVEDGDPVAHLLAVRDDRQLYGLDALGVDVAALEGAHQVRDGDHRDLVDRFEAGEPGTRGGVTHVLRGVEPRHTGSRGARGGGGEGDGLLLGAALGRAGLLGDLDELGVAGLGDQIALDVLAGRDVVRLHGLAGLAHQQPEAVLRGVLALGVGDLHGEVGARAGLGRDEEPAERDGSGGLGDRALGRALRGAADAHDVGRAAAVGEEAVDGVRQIGVGGEGAERLHVLVPVGHQRRLVEGARPREADEGCDRGADTLDGPRSGLHLLHVNTGGEVRRHARSFWTVTRSLASLDRPAGRGVGPRVLDPGQ